LTALVPLPKGGGELIGGDASRDPFPPLLEAAVVQGYACQLVLHAAKQEEVRRRKIRRIGRVAEHLDVLGGEPILHDGGGVDWGVVSVEKPTLLGQNFLKCLMKTSRTFTMYAALTEEPLGTIDEALAVEEGEQHLFCSARLHLGLYWARLTLLYELLGLFFALRHMVTNHRLVHSDDGVQHGKRVALDRFNELRADLDALVFLLVIQKFGDPPGRLLLNAQIVVKHGVNCRNGCPMGRSKRLDAHPAVIFNGGGDRGDESRGPHGFFAVETALISCRFSLFTLLMMA
jgi:hypothetical protein